MIFEELVEYSKDLKTLSKRLRSLKDDIETLKKVLKISPEAIPPKSVEISNLGIETTIIKFKKIACKSLKGRGANSGLRLVYVYLAESKTIVFIEIYFKGDKELEDRNRILSHFD